MAGENIEDLKIDILKMSDEDIEKKYSFLPKKFNT